MVTLNEREQGLISIIMPTYKRGEMIIEAIDSVLMQTYMNFEVIVVDDCSPDNTKEILEKQYGYEPRVKYYRNEKNSGAGVTRKNGYLRSIELAKKYDLYRQDYCGCLYAKNN